MDRVFARLSRRDWLIAAFLLGLVVTHFLVLRVTPPGFYVDEAMTGAHVTSMLAHGTDANGTAWPLFSSSLGGGYTTPVYLYPLVGWASLFGTHEYSLRAFSTFVTILAIFVLGIGARMWTRDKRTSYIVWITGLLLPWAWIGGSVAWDPAILPLYVALAWLGFSGLVQRKNHRTLWLLLMGGSLLFGAYAYPPFRVSGPILLLAASGYSYYKHRINYKHLVTVGAILTFLALPLLQFLLQPGSMGRAQSISVFASGGLLGGFIQMLYNVILLINPFSLFVAGDPNLRHSTGLFGMLGGIGLIGMIGLFMMWRRPHKQLNSLASIVPLAAIGVIVSFIGSALTNEGQPHYLRATAAWPFFTLLIAAGWQRILLMRRRYIVAAMSLCAVLTVAYLVDLTLFYPTRSASAFDDNIRQDISHNIPVSYPDSAINYYRDR